MNDRTKKLLAIEQAAKPFGGVKILELFDAAMDPEDAIRKGEQRKLNGLAIILTELENEFPEEDGTSLSVPLLCKIQALQAAYLLGNKRRAVHEQRNGQIGLFERRVTSDERR